MLKFGIFVCLLTVLAVTLSHEPEEEVAGAHKTKNNPDITSIFYPISRNNVVVCAGTVVGYSRRHIIIATAAHCIYRVDTAKLTVSDMEHKTIRPVDRIIVHPYYMPPLVQYDVALIMLKKYDNHPSTFLELSDKEPTLNSDTISVVELDTKAASVALIQAHFEDRKSCRAKLAKNVTVSSKMLCADFQSTLVPDGSPLLFQGKVAGIASYGLRGNLPKIFTNVANTEIFSFIDHYI